MPENKNLLDQLKARLFGFTTGSPASEDMDKFLASIPNTLVGKATSIQGTPAVPSFPATSVDEFKNFVTGYAKYGQVTVMKCGTYYWLMDELFCYYIRV
jgi:hypothetical protein